MVFLKAPGTHPAESDMFIKFKIQGPTVSITSLKSLAGRLSDEQAEGLKLWTVFDNSEKDIGIKSSKTTEHKGKILGSGATPRVKARILATLSMKNLQNLSHRRALGMMPVCSGGLIILF